MGVRAALSRLPFVASNPADPAAVLNARPHPRKVEPEKQRTLPPEVDLPRIVSSPWVFRRRGITVISYLFIVFACLVIAAVGYSTFTFSRYQNVILPGVYVSSQDFGNMTPSEASDLIDQDLVNMHYVPVRFTYHGHTYMPNGRQFDLGYNVAQTVQNAFSIGRSGSIWSNLIQRFPIRRHFDVALVTNYRRDLVRNWIDATLVTPVRRPMVNAWLKIEGDRAVVEPSVTGERTDTKKALQEFENALGYLHVRRIPVPVISSPPAVTNGTSQAVADRINRFLRNPPVFKFGKHLISTSPSVLAGMIYIPPRPTGTKVTSIVPEITDQAAIYRYTQQLCDDFDEAPQEPQSSYNAGIVSAEVPARAGRTVDSVKAYKALLKAFTKLTPNVRIPIPVKRVPVTPQASNPASLGVTTLLGEGQINFTGAPAVRALDIQRISALLNGVVVQPDANISFDYYAGQGPDGAGWPSRVYQDGERLVGGQAIMPPGGAIDQVATTFFEAGYYAGLEVLERHGHNHLLPWYRPVGTDAVVSTVEDLRFRNNTGGFLYIQSVYQPVPQSLSIYIYGHNTRWTVRVSAPSVSNPVAPGSPIQQLDPNLHKGRRIIAKPALKGETAVVTRTITTHLKHHNTRTTTDSLDSEYVPQQELILVGTHKARPKPTPTATPTPTPTATSTPSPTPVTSPTRTPTSTPTPTVTHPVLKPGIVH